MTEVDEALSVRAASSLHRASCRSVRDDLRSTICNAASSWEVEMAKGKSKRGREEKKPKKIKEKVLATADSLKGKTVTAMTGKNTKPA
ncbi:hypothetical protein [Roseivivax halodurans]|nr:hypothetical protein [Roseivivax halodurans]